MWLAVLSAIFPLHWHISEDMPAYILKFPDIADTLCMGPVPTTLIRYFVSGKNNSSPDISNPKFREPIGHACGGCC